MAKQEDYPIELREAAKQLGLTLNGVRRLAGAGMLPSRCIGPLREPRFKRQDLEAFTAAASADERHRELLASVEAVRPLIPQWDDESE